MGTRVLSTLLATFASSLGVTRQRMVAGSYLYSGGIPSGGSAALSAVFLNPHTIARF